VKAAYDLYREAWRRIANGDVDRLAELVAPSFSFRVNDTELSFEDLRRFMQSWREGFSDFGRNRKEEEVVDNNGTLVAVHQILSATHSGLFIVAPGVPLAPSGRTVEISFVEIIEARKGLIGRWIISCNPNLLVAQIQPS
jgi:ketosteroid isomerase-like protein